MTALLITPEVRAQIAREVDRALYRSRKDFEAVEFCRKHFGMYLTDRQARLAYQYFNGRDDA